MLSFAFQADWTTSARLAKCGTIGGMASKVVELAEGPVRARATERETLAALTRIASRMRPPGVVLEPEDIAQEAYLRVRSRINEGTVLGRSYLWRAAYTAMIDLLRRERAEQRRRTQLSIVDEAPGPSPEAGAHGAEIGVAIDGCVKDLPDDRQRVVVLHLLGHGVKDVSTLLDAPYKRIENLLYRGLRALRSCLDGKGFRP